MIDASAALLEFDSLRELLGRYVAGPAARSLLAAVAPLSGRAALEESHAICQEAIRYLQAAAQPQVAARGAAMRFHFDGLPDLSPHIAKLGIEGAVLDAREILDILQTLDRACDIRHVLEASAQRPPRLGRLGARIAGFRPLLEELAGVIEPDATVSDRASAALRHIRRDIDRQQRLIQDSLEAFLRAHREDGVLQEEFITIRNDRFVLPIVTGQKRRVEGVIHGASGTGHTLFIEPFETVQLNNELVRLRNDEIREVHRILDEIASRFRACRADIVEAVAAMAEIELVFAKAQFALDFGGVIPRFSPPGQPRLYFREARHPLLEDVLRRQKKHVVPLTLDLSAPARTLLISGPNTGGKTVALKTAGLLVLMAQSGIPVPCAEAELPVFEQVLADIGDNQSIQESLSTFSAHIVRVREIVACVSPDSLVLLDELGRATDPEEGGALGVSILESIRSAGAFTLASTHLTPLKVYGATTEGVVNGAMSFDQDSLAPTYVLRIGMPGASAALDIARRLGLSGYLLDQARARMSSSQRDLARLLATLEERLAELERLRDSLEREREVLAAEQAQLARTWEKREAARLGELDRRMESLIADFERRAAETVESIVRGAGEKRAAAQAQRRVAKTSRELREEFQSAVMGAQKPAIPGIEEGVRVRLKGVREPAQVLRKLGGGAIEVQAGMLRLQVGLDDVLEVLPETRPAARLPRNVTLKAAPRLEAQFRELHLIGMHAEEARETLDKFLDDAFLAGLRQVRIVHGHGMGVLKRVVNELLSSHPHVERFHPAHESEGGSGATVAELRQE